MTQPMVVVVRRPGCDCMEVVFFEFTTDPDGGLVSAVDEYTEKGTAFDYLTWETAREIPPLCSEHADE